MVVFYNEFKVLKKKHENVQKYKIIVSTKFYMTKIYHFIIGKILPLHNLQKYWISRSLCTVNTEICTNNCFLYVRHHLICQDKNPCLFLCQQCVKQILQTINKQAEIW